MPVVQRTLPHACHGQHHFCPYGVVLQVRSTVGQPSRRVRSAVGMGKPCRRSALALHTQYMWSRVGTCCSPQCPQVVETSSPWLDSSRASETTQPQRTAAMCEARVGLAFRASCAARTAAAGKGTPAAMGLSRRFRPCRIAHSWDRSISRRSCSCLSVLSVSRSSPAGPLQEPSSLRSAPSEAKCARYA